MTWEEYYDKFYDWARSTQIKHLSSVEHLGSEDEVAEVLMEFAFDCKDVANRLARRSIEEKIKFSAENIMDFKLSIDDNLLNQLAIQSAEMFSEDDLEDLQLIIDDESVAQVYQTKGLKKMDDFDDAELEDFSLYSEAKVLERAKQPTGFFSKVATAFGIGHGIHQGIDSTINRKRRIFRVGDHVRVKYRGQEGTIIDINGDLYMVSLNDGGYVDSYYESQLEKAW